MTGKIIWWVVSFGCAILFYSIGVYATKLEKPMWFWSGVEVKDSEITDVEQYNKANGRMWKLYSLWYWIAGGLTIWDATVAVVPLILGCTVGMVLLVATYRKIYEKYKVK